MRQKKTISSKLFASLKKNFVFFSGCNFWNSRKKKKIISSIIFNKYSSNTLIDIFNFFAIWCRKKERNRYSIYDFTFSAYHWVPVSFRFRKILLSVAYNPEIFGWVLKIFCNRINGGATVPWPLMTCFRDSEILMSALKWKQWKNFLLLVILKRFIGRWMSLISFFSPHRVNILSVKIMLELQ